MSRNLIATFGAVLFWAAPCVAREVSADAVPLDAPVVVMGEEHDVPAHHANQAEWVRRLAPSAIVFEMLPPDLGPVAMETEPERLGDALQWDARGWGDFTLYAPIFAAAGDALILGADVSRDDLMIAVGEGALAAMPGAEIFGLDQPLPPDEQARREEEQADAHCGLMPAEMLGGMVEAQRLRDASLAAAVLDGLDRTQGPVAVITGNGHARRDRGVPALLAAARPDLDVLALGQFTAPTPEAPYDAWVVADVPAGREDDPCAALR